MNGCGKPPSGTSFLDIIQNERPDSAIPSYDRTLIYKLVLVASGVENNGNAIIFGTYENDTSGKVTLTMAGSLTPAFVNRELGINPYQIVGMKFYVSNAINFFNVWTIQKNRATGGMISGYYNPSDFYSPSNNQSTIIEDWRFKLTVDGTTKLTVPVTAPANTTATEFIVFYVKTRGTVSNIVIGESLCEATDDAPLPMGNLTDQILIKNLEETYKQTNKNLKCRC